MRNALSLFDGCSGGQLALKRRCINYGTYYASENDKYAMAVTQHHFPKTVQLGDVTKWREWDIDFSKIDLLTAGFPCQAWSLAGKQQGDNDPRGALIHDLLDIWSEVKRWNPNVKFLFENVKMKKEFLDYVNGLFGVEPILINSALVSAQNRQRYYWTNIEGVEQPKDRGILLKDILESNGDGMIKSHGTFKLKDDKPQCLDANYHKGADNHGQRTLIQVGTATDIKGNDRQLRIYSDEGKAPTLLSSAGGNKEPKISVNSNKRVKGINENERGYRPHRGDIKSTGISELGRISKETASKTDSVTTSHSPKIAVNGDIKDLWYRKLTPLECERLQTMPDNYTLVPFGKRMMSNTQRYKMIGNGWTVAVIEHIYKELD
jgi:DNA-cytosine methyltransferase